MGTLRGELDLIGIDNLLQALSARLADGYLEVRRDAQRIVLSISPMGIRLISGVRRVRPLGDILVRAGKISQEQLDRLLAGTQRPLGEVVIQQGILPQAIIESALKKQVAEEIHELLSWTGAQFEFRPASEGAPPGDDGPRSSVLLDGNVMGIMLEAARRTDELEQIRALIPDDCLVPMLMELPGRLDDSGLDRTAVEEIAPLVDGQRSVEDILQSSLYPTFTVLRTLYGLAMTQVLKIRDRSRRDGPTTVLGQTKTHVVKKSRGHAVLVMSDSSTFRPALSLRLHGAGYTVFEERTSASLEQVLERHRPHAIVVDVALETPEGKLVCRRLRDVARVPYVLITANAGPPLSVSALESGAHYVLLKTLDESRLLDRLGELLPR